MIATFSFGRIVATPGALQALERANQSASHFLGAPCGPGLGRTRPRGYPRERVQSGARLSTVEQLHDSRRRKTLDYHGSRPFSNHAAVAGRILIEGERRILPALPTAQ